ncbi:MAG TPA: hypothetical protein VGY66_00455 [Gemmataceae bacterium]|jgi:hypothetical protein|nr:hypothetical protein [Gemmataceae bacterium]
MKAEEVFQVLAQKPFQPMRVHVRDGRILEIRSRQLAVVGVSWLDIGIPAPGETEAIYDYVLTIPLDDIVKIEHGAKVAQAPG